MAETNGANINTSGAMPASRYGLARVMTNGEMVYADDFKPKNIMLTGGAGFIGSHVAILLAQKYPDYKVRPNSVPQVAGQSCHRHPSHMLLTVHGLVGAAIGSKRLICGSLCRLSCWTSWTTAPPPTT